VTAPAGWKRQTLGELGRYLNGRGFKKQEWRSAGRPIIRIQNLTGSSDHFNYFEGEADDRHVVYPGDLLVSWAATLGAYIWNGPEAVLNQHIFKVESYIDLKFHKYLLDHKLEELMRHTHGSGMVHITRGRFDAVPVDVPPIQEQRRIVDLLEDHLSRLDAADRGLSLSQAKLNGLREQAITRAVTAAHLPGRVAPVLADLGTNDDDLPSLPVGWSWERLGDVADVVGGVTKDAKKQGNPSYEDVPYLRVANVQRGYLNLDTVTHIRVDPAKATALRLQTGDVLMNEGGDRDKLARGWVWEGQIDNCIHQNHVFRARIHEPRLDPYFLSWTTNTFGGRWAERNGKQSVNLASISLSMIRRMPVIVPPAGVASDVVSRLRDQLESYNRLAGVMAGSRTRGVALRRALLAAAFDGRLTNSKRLDERLESVLGV
jgi:type I restriction enzyme S subunit